MRVEPLPGTAGVAPLLDGFGVSWSGGEPAGICAGHLALLGADPDAAPIAGGAEDGAGDEVGVAGRVALAPEPGRAGPGEGEIACTIHWAPPASGAGPSLRGEAVLQAVSGLMEVHGRDRGSPARLGLDVASCAAGVVAAQGMLAVRLAALRGTPVRAVETSVLQAALLFLSHHLAVATSGDPFLERSAADFANRFPGSRPAPPFRTADGHAVEVEAMSPQAWSELWDRLGAPAGEVDEAWRVYVFRYLSGRCLLPPSLHEAAGRHTLAQLRAAARAAEVEVRPVRTYGEVLESPEWRGGPPPPWRIAETGGARGRGAVRRPEARAPLAGVRVVDLTTRLQGPLASGLLRMLGAEVVRVEPPGGDVGRVGPVRSLHAAYLAYNRGKEVVELDYTRPEGRARLVELARGADVWLHNWRPGRAERLGLDAAALGRAAPGLVYAHAAGWGDGENGAPAGDFLVQAHAACPHGLTPAGEAPAPSRLAFVDILGGLVACEGVLAGLCLRERTGRGCRVDTDLFSGALMLQGDVLRGVETGDEHGRRDGRPLWGPLAAPVPAADGLLVLDVEDGDILRRAARVCGADPEGDHAEVAARVTGRLRARPAAEWERLLAGAGVPACAVRETLGEVAADPRVAPLLEDGGGGCRVPAAPWRFDGARPSAVRRGRLPGRDRLAQVVGRLGAQAEALGALAAALELRLSHRRADPAVETRLAEVLESLGAADLFDGARGAELAPFGALARARLLQAADLAADPAAAPGWRYTDPAVLRAQGDGSAAFAPVLRHAVTPRLEGLAERLAAPGAALLDVGAGVAALTIALCRDWPRLRAVAIDVWEPALALARENVAAAGMDGRIELRHQDVAELADTGAYDLVWLPASFLSPEVLRAALPRLHAATRPGGWVVLNAFGGMDALTAALADLRTVRSGGTVISPDEAEALLASAGFAGVRTLPREILPPVALTVGRRPPLPPTAPTR
ncbi:MAG TPA: CoA transferase [Longimicrobium sp.]|nr:CoA transferase [Longimicrobium sp.]